MSEHPKGDPSAPFEGPSRIVDCTFVDCTFVASPKSDSSEAEISSDEHPPREPGESVVFSNCTFVNNSG